jgi:hypothetical protein
LGPAGAENLAQRSAARQGPISGRAQPADGDAVS